MVKVSHFSGEIVFVISLTVVGGGRQEFQKPGFLQSEKMLGLNSSWRKHVSVKCQ